MKGRYWSVRHGCLLSWDLNDLTPGALPSLQAKPAVSKGGRAEKGDFIPFAASQSTKVITVEKRLWHHARKVRLKAFLAFVALWGTG